MLSVLHHNENLDVELSGTFIVEKITQRIGRANGLLNERIYKTIIRLALTGS